MSPCESHSVGFQVRKKILLMVMVSIGLLKVISKLQSVMCHIVNGQSMNGSCKDELSAFIASSLSFTQSVICGTVIFHTRDVSCNVSVTIDLQKFPKTLAELSM